MKAIRAWHFLRSDCRLGHEDGRLVVIGETLSADGKPALCKNGMHASVKLIDALSYAPGPVLCRVEISGDVLVDDDQIVGRNRKPLWLQDVSEQLHLFACEVAEKALQDRIDAGEKTDPRSHAAIQAKRDWLAGKITDEELNAALDAAWDAARDAARAARAAAWSAAWAAARAAASRAAAKDAASRAAARDAAWAAAWAAARAARAAAWSAAWAAAWAAAWDAARDAQNERLTAIMHEMGAPE